MNANIFFFSATGTTKKIVKAFAEGLSCPVRYLDITQPVIRENIPLIESDLVVIAAPVYGERIHAIIIDYLKQINGNGKPLVVFSVYGNVGFGISLAQFEQYARENHFLLIGAGAFIGEHTYASEEVPVAYQRPDERDLEQAKEFGKQIREKLDAGSLNSIKLPTPNLPGFISNFPDGGTRFLIKQPVVDKNLCNQCGACARKCPLAAIDPITFQICEKKCIRCYACVRVCPKSARRTEFRKRFFGRVFKFMGGKRKENQVYL